LDMFNTFRRICLLVMVSTTLLCSAESRAKSSFYITFSVPNSTRTQPVAINDWLTVTGFWEDAAGDHGFVRNLFGTITQFDAPGTTFTLPTAINNAGIIVGHYSAASGSEEGFLRTADGKFTTIAPGGRGSFALAAAINDSGMVTGSYQTGSSGDLPTFGFLRYPDGGIVTFSIPGSTDVEPTSINAGGDITGHYTYEGGTQIGGFVRHGDGHIATFDYALGIVPTSINQSGTISGWYGGTTAFGGFVRSRNGKITPYDAPGPILTQYIDIDAAGDVVGAYGTVPSSGTQHGFLRRPDGRFLTLDAPGAVFTYPTCIDDFGVVAGFYFLPNNTTYTGFLWIP
jgi:hypothetical protein